MRISALFCVIALLSGPGAAQQMAMAPAAPDCPPGEPDSLQISWTAPCDEGNWLLDTAAGCRIWDWHPDPQDQVVWKGACHAGRPDGQGQAQWYEHGQAIDRFAGSYHDGKRQGRGHYTWNDTVRFEGSYADDVPQGPGVLTLDGVVLGGEWDRGCLAQDGKVAAIGVPRTSCTASGKATASTADR